MFCLKSGCGCSKIFSRKTTVWLTRNVYILLYENGAPWSHAHIQWLWFYVKVNESLTQNRIKFSDCYWLNCTPHCFICWSPNPYYLRMGKRLLCTGASSRKSCCGHDRASSECNLDHYPSGHVTEAICRTCPTPW